MTSYKTCAVPMCRSTTIKYPDKLFIHVPNGPKRRKQWLQLARRNPELTSDKSTLFFCEDHFDLPNDMENYIRHSVMGSVGKIRMKPDCLPSKFQCQPDRIKLTAPPQPRSAVSKRRRMDVIQEILSKETEIPATSDMTSNSDMDKHRCLQVTSTPAIAACMNVATGSVVQDNTLNIKEEPLDTELDIGPTVLQHMDAPFRHVQPDVSNIKQERKIKDNDINPVPGGGVKEEINEEERRGVTDAPRNIKAAQSTQRVRFSCAECAKTYASKGSLTQHYRNVHSKEFHKCPKCNKKCASVAYLDIHISNAHSKREYECAVCRKMYESKTALSNHVYYAHRPRPAGSHQLQTCTNCGKDFKSIQNCQQHEKRGTCTRPTASSTSAAASTSRQQRNVVIVKEEPAGGELELGPTVFQHMDCNYRPYKQEPQLD